MNWNLQLTGPAQKDFRRLPSKDQPRVRAALLAMQEDPFAGDIKRLKGGSTAWRRRVGQYRIIYDLYLLARTSDCRGRDFASHFDNILNLPQN